MKIANKIILSFFLVTIILGGTAMSVIYIIAKDNLQKSIYNNLSAVAASRANHIETYLKALEASVNQLSKSVILENLLEISAVEGPSHAKAFEDAMTRLTRTHEANPAIADFLLLDETGKVVASSDKRDIGLDKSTDVFFIEGKKNIFIKDVYHSEPSTEPLLAVAAPFLNRHTGKLAGVIAARVKLNELNNIVMEKTGMGNTGEIYIVNKYGYMITPSRFDTDTVLKQSVDTLNVRISQLHISREHLSEKTRIIIFPDYSGVQVLGTHEYIPLMKWSVLAEIHTNEAFKPLVKIRLVFLAILFTMLLAAWLLGIFIAKLITDPIHKLHKGIEIIGSGNLDYKVGTNANDEVGQLSRAFDEMTENLKKTTTSIDILNKEIFEREKSEALFKAIFDNATDGILLADMDTKKIYTGNNAACQMLGYSLDEFIKLGIADIHPEKDLPDILDKFEKSARGDIKEIECIPMKRKDGSIFYVNIKPFFLTIGGKKFISGIFKDITQRKKIEDDLRKSEERYRKQFEESIDAIFLSDKTGTILDCNIAATKLIGREKPEIIGKHQSFLHPAESIINGLSKSFRSQQSGVNLELLEDRVITGSGQIKDVAIRASSISIEDKEVILGIFRDITEQKKTEAALEDSHKSLTSILDSMDSVVYVADFDTYEILFINKYGRKSWGDIQGHICWKSIQEGQKGPCTFCTNDRLVSDTGLPTGVYFWEFQNMVNGRWYECKDQAIPWGNKGLVRMEIATDITDRKDIEKSQRLAQLGMLVANIAHEVNNPLMVISGRVQLSMMEDGQNEEVKNNFRIIFDECQRAKDIIQRLRQFAQPSKGEPRLIDINTSIESIVAILEKQYSLENIVIKRAYGQGLPSVFIDEKLMQEVFMNLINNAHDAISHDGQIQIITTQQGAQVRIDIQDTGAGMPAEVIAKIFEPFFTTKEKGTGLGLSVSNSIIKTHHGKITVDSTPGKGTTVSIILPIDYTSSV